MKKYAKNLYIVFVALFLLFLNTSCSKTKDTEKDLETKENIKIEEILKENKEVEEDKNVNYFSNIEKYINDKISKYGENISLSFLDIKTGEEINLNGDVYFTAASTSKLPLNMVLYDQVFEGVINLEDKMNYNDAFFEDGTGIIQEDIQDSYSIEKLANYSIIYSDNIATNMLYDYLGGYTVVRNKFNEYLGYEAKHSGNQITSNQAKTYLKILYENKNKNPYYDKLINNLKNTVFKMRMSKNIENEMVAHKIGTYEPFINDIGIVYGKNPFILSIYTNSIIEAENLITEITDYIYNQQNLNYPF